MTYIHCSLPSFMIDVILVLSVAVVVWLLCGIHIVPAKRIGVVRHAFTQNTRIVGQGARYLSPWESICTKLMPMGDDVIEWSYFPAHDTTRYDPAPYTALTRDQVEIKCDTWIDFLVVDPQAVALSSADMRMVLDDQVRAKTQEIVAQMKRIEISATDLAPKLKAVEWKPTAGLQVVHVGVQSVKFDERTRELLRAQSMGITATEALAHVEATDLSTALREGRNTHVILQGEKEGGMKLRPRAGTGAVY